MHALCLVLTFDPLEDRRIGDSNLIQIWQLRDSLNQSQFFAKHSNQSVASFCIDNRFRQSVIFLSVKVVKFEIKRLSVHIF